MAVSTRDAQYITEAYRNAGKAGLGFSSRFGSACSNGSITAFWISLPVALTSGLKVGPAHYRQVEVPSPHADEMTAGHESAGLH